MESSSAYKYITPTLQSNFNYAIGEVLKRMNNMDIADTWQAIETLYTILPPKIFEQVQSEYKTIIAKVNKVNSGDSVDYMAMVTANNETKRVLGELAIPFFRRMYEALYAGGYLEKKTRAIESNVGPKFFQPS